MKELKELIFCWRCVKEGGRTRKDWLCEGPQEQSFDKVDLISVSTPKVVGCGQMIQFLSLFL